MNIVINKNTIPNKISLVNKIMFSRFKMLVKLGVTIANANHAAERFPVTEDKAFRKACLFLFINKL